MPNLDVPVKTALGQQELRSRTRRLGQRHRTVLLLVDGRRPLGEVLAMAHKAGAQTSHFEELVRMGLVEVPAEKEAPEPQETAPGGLDVAHLTSVELDVPDEASALPQQEPAPPGEVVEAAPPVQVPVVEAFDVELGSAHGLPMIHVSVLEAEAGVTAQQRHAQDATEAVALSAPRAPDWTQVREAPFKVADHARPAPRMSDEDRLQYVRDLLLDTLRRDTLLFASFAVGRVRAAQTHRELIKLVWEIERDRAHSRRNRDQLLNLQRARELLGMGNTLVAGDSQPGPVSEY